MSKKATTTTKANIYQIVTERIIASLRTGIIPWEKPWQALHFSVAHSLATSSQASRIEVSTCFYFGPALTATHFGSPLNKRRS
jgi:antirestriction protein ArdC